MRAISAPDTPGSCGSIAPLTGGPDSTADPSDGRIRPTVTRNQPPAVSVRGRSSRWPTPAGKPEEPARFGCLEGPIVEKIPAARYKERAPGRPSLRLGARLISLDAKAEGLPTNRPRRITRTHTRGEGAFVRLDTVSQPIGQCKGRSLDPPDISPDVPPPRRQVPLSPDDRARCLAEIRAVLADAAPTFRARVAAGESEARP
jgi:hypothetical protein